MKFSFFMPTKIYFGVGEVNRLARIALPGKRALIVTTCGGSVKRNGTLDTVTDLLKQNGVDTVLFDKVLPNPIKDHVMDGARLAKDSLCDFVLGLGGGSAIDAAKAIAVMAKNPGDYWDYMHSGSGLKKSLVNGALPIVAVTTTAGTGTEADPWTVTTKTETNEKIGFGCDATFPVISIVDPGLMVSVPANFTAFQGMDAFFHAAEGFIATCANAASEGFSLQTVELITKFLPVAVRDGQDLEARSMVAWANTSAGIVESLSSCTSEHSMAHAISALFPSIPHGVALICISVEYFTFMTKKVPHRLAKLAHAMGVDTRGLAPEQAALRFVDTLSFLIEQTGCAHVKLSDYGVKVSDAKALTENCFHTMGGLFGITPGDMSFDDVQGIFEKSIEKA